MADVETPQPRQREQEVAPEPERVATQASTVAFDDASKLTAKDTNEKDPIQDAFLRGDNWMNFGVLNKGDIRTADDVMLGARGIGADAALTPQDEALKAARGLKGLITAADLRVKNPEKGIDYPQVLAGGGEKLVYKPQEREDRLHTLTRRPVDGGSETTKTFGDRPDGLKSERRLETKTRQELEQTYDPSKNNAGLASLRALREGGKDTVTAQFEGRADGLKKEVRAVDPNGATRIREYADGRREEVSVTKDGKREQKFFDSNGKPMTGEKFQEGQKALEAKIKTEIAASPEKGAKPEKGTQPEKVEGEGVTLPPLKAGWGPYQALEQLQREGKINLTPQQMKKEAERIRDREFAERGIGSFKQNEKLEFYSQKELAERGRAPQEKGPEGVEKSTQKPLERQTNIEQRLADIKKALDPATPNTPENADMLRRQLRDLTPQEIQKLKAGFDKDNPNALGDAIKDRFSKMNGGLDRHAHRWAEVEGHLKKTGKPGEDAAIQLRVDALEAKWAGYDGNRSFDAIQSNTRRTLLGATEEQRKGMDAALGSLYGQGGLSELYEKGPGKNLTYTGNHWYSGEDKFTKQVLDIATKKGVNERTPEEQAGLLNAALKTRNIDNFRDVANKESMTEAGRKYFLESGGLDKINEKQIVGKGAPQNVFSEIQRKELEDLARKGEESPITQFKKAIGTFSNTETALQNGVERIAQDPKLRQLYLDGRELADPKKGREPKTEQEKQALDFYNEAQKTFKSAYYFGSERKAQNFDSQIVNGTKGALSNGIFADLGASNWQHRSDLFKAVEGATGDQLNSLFNGARIDEKGKPQSDALTDDKKSIDLGVNRDVNRSALKDLLDKKVAYGVEVGQIADKIKDTPRGQKVDDKTLQELRDKVPAFKGMSPEKMQQVVEGYRLDQAVRDKTVEPGKLSKAEQQQLVAYRNINAEKSPQEGALKGFLQGRETQRTIDGILNATGESAGTRDRKMNEYIQSLKPEDARNLDIFRNIRNDAVQTNVKRDLKESLGDAKDQQAFIAALKGATPAEQERIKNDPAYQKEIRELAERGATNSDSKLATRMILDSYVNGKPLSKAESATVNALEKVANQDMGVWDKQKAIIGSLKESLRGDKDGSLARDLLANETTKGALSQAIGGERKFSSVIEPLLKTGMVPVAQMERIYGKGGPELFKAGILEATPQGLKHLNSPEGQADRERLLKGLTPEGKSLAEKIIKQGEVKPEDTLRAFTIGYEKQDVALETLKGLPAQQRIDAVRSYNKAFGSNLQEDLLKVVDQDNKATVTLLATENQLTGEQSVVRSREAVTNSTTTWLGHQSLKYDSTIYRSLSDVILADRQYKGQVPPDVMDKRIKELATSLKNFEGTKEELAQMIVEGAITVAAVAATPFTGGTSLSYLLMAGRLAALSGAGGLSGALLKAQLTGNYEHLAGDIAKFGLLTGANLLGGETLTALSGLGTRAAAKTVEKTFAEPAIAGALKGTSPAVREQLQKGLAELIQNGYTAGGVSNAAVRELVGKVPGLGKEAQDLLSKGLIDNLSKGVKEVSTEGIRGTVDKLTRFGRTASLDGTAAYIGDVTGELAKQAGNGQIDVERALVGGINSFFIGTGARGVIETVRAGRAALRRPDLDRSVPSVIDPAPHEVGPHVKRAPKDAKDPKIVDLEPHEYKWLDDPAGHIEGPKKTGHPKDADTVPRLEGPPERLSLAAPKDESLLRKPAARPFEAPADIEKITPEYLKKHGFIEEKFPLFYDARYFKHLDSKGTFGFDKQGRLTNLRNHTADYRFEYDNNRLNKITIDAHDGFGPAVFNRIQKVDHPQRKIWADHLSDAKDTPVKPGYVRLYKSLDVEAPPVFKPLSKEELQAFKQHNQIGSEEFRSLRQRAWLGDGYRLDPESLTKHTEADKLMYVDIPKDEFIKMRKAAGESFIPSQTFKIPDEYVANLREHILSPSNPHAHGDRWEVRKGNGVPEVINGRPPLQIDGHGKVDIADLARGKQFLPEVIREPFEVKIVNYGGSPEYVAKVQEALKSMPLHLRAKLNEDGVTVRIVGRAGDLKSPTDLRDGLRGWHFGADGENSQGHFSWFRKDIVMPEYSLNSRHEWASNLKQVDGTVYHEAGHALDGSLRRASATPAFVEAYMKDIEALGARSWLGRQLARVPNPSKVDYFLAKMSDEVKQNGLKNVGTQRTIADARDEVFAELFAVMQGRSTTGLSGERFKRAFPNSAKAMDDLLKSLEPNPVRIHSRHTAESFEPPAGPRNGSSRLRHANVDDATPHETPHETPVRHVERLAGAAVADAAAPISTKIPIKLSGASPEFAQKVQKFVAALPPELAELTAQGGVKIRVVGNIKDWSSDAAVLAQPMRGQPGRTMADSRGFFDPNPGKKELVLVERGLDGKEFWPGDAVNGLIAHEFGHGVDDVALSHVLKSPAFARTAAMADRHGVQNISDTIEFKHAIFKDMQHLSQVIAGKSEAERDAIAKQLSYYLGNNGYWLETFGLKGIGSHADDLRFHDPKTRIREFGGRHSDARSEVFAELHSALLTGNHQFLELFPNSAKLLRDHVIPSEQLASISDLSADKLKSLGLSKESRPFSSNPEIVRLSSADDSTTAFFVNGRIQHLTKSNPEYRMDFTYGSDGQLTGVRSNDFTVELVGDKWQKRFLTGPNRKEVQLDGPPSLRRIGLGLIVS